MVGNSEIRLDLRDMHGFYIKIRVAFLSHQQKNFYHMVLFNAEGKDMLTIISESPPSLINGFGYVSLGDASFSIAKNCIAGFAAWCELHDIHFTPIF